MAKFRKFLFISSLLAFFRAGVKFVAATSDDMKQAGHLPILTKQLYMDAPGQWKVAPYGPLDTRLVRFVFFSFFAFLWVLGAVVPSPSRPIFSFFSREVGGS